jgi:hypothetical protein
MRYQSRLRWFLFLKYFTLQVLLHNANHTAHHDIAFELEEAYFLQESTQTLLPAAR